jgi:hypothetical protein
MREFREIRKGLGENAEAAAPYLGVARTQLGILKARMAHGQLGQLTRTVTLEDGTSITVSSRMGQDSVRITAASPNVIEELPTPEVREADIPEPDEPPRVPLAPDLEAVFLPGEGETYSAPYVSSIVKGAVMDKTGKTVFLALAAPDYDQNASLYSWVASGTGGISLNPSPAAMGSHLTQPNASQLVQLDHKLQEVTRAPVTMPDWGGQFTYDFATDCFYLNVFTATDPRFTSSISPDNNFPYEDETIVLLSHRSLLQITKAGGQTEMAAEVISDTAIPVTLWGNSTWALGWTGGSSFLDESFGGNFGSDQTAAIYPISQPSTSGLIAAMFPGHGSNLQYQSIGFIDDGYPFLWDTRKQAIVWRGNALGTYKGDAKVDPWAVITPLGNAIFSVLGALVVVQMGSGVTGFGTPPPGVTDLAVTNGDKLAYALAGGRVLQCRLGVWRDVTPASAAGNLLAVLHDLVTDAVAVVLADGSGVWIFNGHTPQGMPLAAFKIGFARAPTQNPAFIYPQQFINGSLLVTYAVPGGDTAGGGPYVFELNGAGVNWIASAPYGMPANFWPGQPTPAWRAQLGRGGRDPSVLFDGEQSAYNGSTTPVSWIVGRYDIGQLQATSSA